MHAHAFIGKTTMFITKFLPEKIIKIIDFFLADNDGINSYNKRASWQHDEESLRELYQNLGFKKILKLTDDFIGVWE